MFGQHTAVAHTAGTYVYDYLETLGGCSNPSFGKTHALFLGKHIALTAAAIDKHALKSVLVQHLRIGWNRLQINITILTERGKRGIDKAHYFLKSHSFKMFRINVLFRFLYYRHTAFAVS